jgi:hypothetical protein
VITVLLLGVATALLASCSGPPPKVDRITVVNPTGYDLDLQVSDADRDSWLPAGIAEAGSRQITEEVIDQGEIWVFRFMHRGDPVGELEITRSELERNGWRVEVPAEVDERLRQMGRPTFGEIPGS